MMSPIYFSERNSASWPEGSWTSVRGQRRSLWNANIQTCVLSCNLWRISLSVRTMSGTFPEKGYPTAAVASAPWRTQSWIMQGRTWSCSTFSSRIPMPRDSRKMRRSPRLRTLPILEVSLVFAWDFP